MTASAKNLAGKWWTVGLGVQGFEMQRAYGVVNAAGTHALGSNGAACRWMNAKATKVMAQYADRLVADGAHTWVRIYDSIAEAREAARAAYR